MLKLLFILAWPWFVDQCVLENIPAYCQNGSLSSRVGMYHSRCTSSFAVELVTGWSKLNSLFDCHHLKPFVVDDPFASLEEV